MFRCNELVWPLHETLLRRYNCEQKAKDPHQRVFFPASSVTFSTQRSSGALPKPFARGKGTRAPDRLIDQRGFAKAPG